MTRKKAVALGAVYGLCFFTFMCYIIYYELTYGVSLLGIWQYSKLHFVIAVAALSIGVYVFDYFRKANKGNPNKPKHKKGLFY